MPALNFEKQFAADWPVAKYWGVDVRIDGETLLTIEHAHLSGKPDFTDLEKATIRHCAKHLLAFIGD